jgi:hypothetical protein
VIHARVVSRLAIRELWMSFRLLLILVVCVAAGVAVTLLPAPLPATMERLAIGLTVAAVVGGAVAAWSLGTERQRGRAGWIVARSVARGTYLWGWFAALSMVVLAGHLVASGLGWLAATAVALDLDAALFAAATFAMLAASFAALALGTLAGVLLPAAVATALTVAVAGALAAVALATSMDVGWLPFAGGFAVLAALGTGEAILGSALVAAGAGLAMTGLLLALARLAIERVEL